MPLGGEGWPAAEMLEKPWNVKKSKRLQTLNRQNKANPSQQLCNLWHIAGTVCSVAAVSLVRHGAAADHRWGTGRSTAL